MRASPRTSHWDDHARQWGRLASPLRPHGDDVENVRRALGNTSGQFGFVQSANTPPVIVPPSQGIQVTMPTSISQNNSSGGGVGKAKENECAVQ